MKAIFRIEQQQGHSDTAYDVETIPPVGAAVTLENQSRYRVNNVEWGAAEHRCYPVVYLTVAGDALADDL